MAFVFGNRKSIMNRNHKLSSFNRWLLTHIKINIFKEKRDHKGELCRHQGPIWQMMTVITTRLYRTYNLVTSRKHFKMQIIITLNSKLEMLHPSNMVYNPVFIKKKLLIKMELRLPSKLGRNQVNLNHFYSNHWENLKLH